MKKISFTSLLLIVIGLCSCGSATSDEASLQASDSIQEANPTEVTGDVPVDVTWKLCVPEGTFPLDTSERNTDEQGCRRNEDDITVWSLEDGTVEVVWIRERIGAYGRDPTKPYVLMTRSRGCAPEGPGEEGYYLADDYTYIDADWAADRTQIPVEDITLTAVEREDVSEDELGLEMFGTEMSCKLIDLETDSY